jgi:hypothetical protein
MSVEVEDRPPSWLELESVKPLRPDIEAVTSLSRDTLARRYAEYIVQLSPRRKGMKLRNALKIASGAI